MRENDKREGDSSFTLHPSSIHEPVLFSEVIEFLRPVDPDGTIVDATLGLGGHAEGLLKRYGEIRLVGIDRDPMALELAGRRLASYGARTLLVEGRHESLIEILEREGIGEIDGLLADLGVSSMQLDDADRGFSFRFDGPLDMRMGRGGESAADLVNTIDERELVSILREYGEEPMARRIAAAIVAARVEAPITTTAQLAEIIRSVKKPRGDRIDPSTLTFQALRIAVNRELVELEEFLESAILRLRSGGRIAVISFHSLEDRIVKRLLRRLEGRCTCPPGMPVCGCGATAVVKVLTSRPIEASDGESARNPRARSAKLRVAEKL